MKIKDKVCVITGGASGLGAATARLMKERGARVAILDLNEPKDGSKDGSFYKVDVSDPSSVKAAFDGIMEEFGAVHILVTCAGYIRPMPVISPEGGLYPLDLFKKIVDINLTGTFIVAAAAVEQMMKNTPVNEDGEKGVIITVGSIAGLDVSSSLGYAASKGGVMAMTLTFAKGLAAQGIRLNSIAPGMMRTPIMDPYPDAEANARETAVFPKRFGNPSEFADLAAVIVEHEFFNATVLRLDAGKRQT